MIIDFHTIAEQAVGRAMLSFQPKYEESCEKYQREKSWQYAPGKAVYDHLPSLLTDALCFALEQYHKTLSGEAFLLSPEQKQEDCP